MLSCKFARAPAALLTRLASVQHCVFGRPFSSQQQARLSRAIAAESLPSQASLSTDQVQPSEAGHQTRCPANTSWRQQWQPDTSSSDYTYYATCHPGLEQVVAAELGSLQIGAEQIAPGKAGVRFRGTGLTGYRASLWLRSGIRVLRLLAKGQLSPYRAGGDEIYSFFRQATNWHKLLPPRQTFTIKARVTDCTDIPSSYLVQIRGRDAICDSIRDARGNKPFPPQAGQAADLPLYAALFRDECSLYLDMSGESLHKRGYRSAMHASSLNESAAAGMLSLADWPTTLASGGVLADPMCGSGTLLIEAALMATNTAPGLFRRRFPFQSWPDFDRSAWDSVVEAAADARVEWDGLLMGNDLHQGALKLAKRDAKAAGIAKHIKWHDGPCSQWVPRAPPSTVVVNPPWGRRLLNDAEEEDEAEPERWFAGDQYQGRRGVSRRAGSQGHQQPEHRPYEGTDLQAAWIELRTFLKGQCPNASAYVLCGNPDITREIHMRADKKYPIIVGNVDCRLLKYKVLPPKSAPKAAMQQAYAYRQTSQDN